MMKKLLAVFALGFGVFTPWLAYAGNPGASIVTSTASTTAVNPGSLAGTSTAPLRVKGCVLSNDTTTDACVTIKDGTTAKVTLCAKADTTLLPPSCVSPVGQPLGGFACMLGDDLVLNGTFNVTSSTPSANMLLTCSVETKRTN